MEWGGFAYEYELRRSNGSIAATGRLSVDEALEHGSLVEVAGVEAHVVEIHPGTRDLDGRIVLASDRDPLLPGGVWSGR